MKKLSDTYKELGIDFTFPIEIDNANGNQTYYENGDGYWWRREWDSDCNQTYYENSDGYWTKCEWDANGNRTYFENSDGYWWKYEYDAKGNQTYYEDSEGEKRGTPTSQSCTGYKWGIKRGSCAGKVVEIDGKKYKLTEL